jgi:hypothetical protein
MFHLFIPRLAMCFYGISKNTSKNNHFLTLLITLTNNIILNHLTITFKFRPALLFATISPTFANAKNMQSGFCSSKAISKELLFVKSNLYEN